MSTKDIFRCAAVLTAVFLAVLVRVSDSNAQTQQVQFDIGKPRNPTIDLCVFNSSRPKITCPVGENIPFETSLLQAIRKGNVGEVKRLIATGAVK